MDVPSVLNEMEDAQDHRADVLSIAAHWYGCVLTARPTLTDHNTDEKYRLRMMKLLVADAESLIEFVYGKGDDTTTLPVPPVVLSGQDDAA